MQGMYKLLDSDQWIVELPWISPDLPNIDLLEIDLSDTDLDLLDADTDSFQVKSFWSLRQNIEDILKACLEEMLVTLSRYLEDVLKTS